MEVIFQEKKHNETFLVRKDGDVKYFSLAVEGQSAEINLGEANLKEGTFTVFRTLRDVKPVNGIPCWGFNKHIILSSKKIKLLKILSNSGEYEIPLSEIIEAKAFTEDSNQHYSDNIWIPTEAISLYEKVPF